jgi:hypothetical protein
MAGSIMGLSPWCSAIIGHGKEPASQLLANPFNHRRHPQKQRDVVASSIAELGFIKSVIVNRTTGHLIDGHERVMQALGHGEETLVDVEYVELSPEKERLALLVLDRSSEMAITDSNALEALLREVQTGDQVLADLLSDWSIEESIVDPDPPIPDAECGKCPTCGREL